MPRGAEATRRRQNHKPGSVYRECIRLIVYEQCDSACWLCGEDVDLFLLDPDPRSPVLDHLLERQDGGRYAAENLLLAHKLCNELRARGET